MKAVLTLCGVVLLCGACSISKPALAAVAPVNSDLNPVSFHEAPQHPPVALIGPGGTVKIVLLPGASHTLLAAVNDLADCVQKATGARAEISAGPVKGPAIFVGDSAEAMGAGLVGSKMPIEGFAIKTATDRVYIVGNDSLIDPAADLRSEGTAWGIYEFCERFLDVRWYWPDALGVSISKRADLTIAPVWLSDAPVFRKREMWPSGGRRVAPADVESLHRRLRSVDTWPIHLRVHAPHDWSTLYKDTRPGIFQKRSDGKRDFDMLCYGNPQTLQTYLEQIERQSKPGVQVDENERIVDGHAVTVSPNDMSVACTCEYCRALWDKDGGQYGTASRGMATFVAKLAGEVKKRWPDMTIIYLPYKNYTKAPAGITFPDNVEVQICGMPGLAQYKEPAINASEQANIDAWKNLSRRKIQNWHYSCWPEDQTDAVYLFPHTIQAHYLANRDKTTGSFVNGVANHWPRQHISLYVWLKVLWNPDFNVDFAIDEYCRRMYGPAAGTMRELARMQIDGWENSRWPGGVFSARGVYESSYPREQVVRMEELLKKARVEAAGDSLANERIEYYATPFPAFFKESKDYAEGTGRRTLSAYQVAEDPVLDGRLDKPCWQGIEPLLFVKALDQQDPQPKYPTELKAVWSRQGITFGFRMSEPTPEKLARDIGADSRDASLIWWNDNVELFLDVVGERTDYYQFIVNPNGAIYDSHGKEISWTAEGAKSAIYLGKDFWSMEVFIPYKAFNRVTLPATGIQWFGNFTRHRVTDRSDREMQRLNTTFAGPSNNPNAFGPIRFVER